MMQCLSGGEDCYVMQCLGGGEACYVMECLSGGEACYVMQCLSGGEDCYVMERLSGGKACYVMQCLGGVGGGLSCSTLLPSLISAATSAFSSNIRPCWRHNLIMHTAKSSTVN